MRVRLEFRDGANRRKPAFVDMQSIPRVGEFLVSGKHGASGSEGGTYPGSGGAGRGDGARAGGNE